jgi:hypothetical protein
MSITRYSQQDEQKHILESLAGIEKGLFLDIGAWNPKIFSNTRALYEMGWSGTLVEPSPGPLKALLAEYGHDPRIQVVGAAVSVNATRLTSMWISENAYSTDQPELYDKWKSVANFVGRVWVPQITMESALALKYAFTGDPRLTYDFVSIDTEGTSVDLFHALIDNGDKVGGAFPMCVAVEHDGRIQELMEVAHLSYQIVHQNDTNVILKRRG